MRISQQLHAFVRNRQRTSENESADGVRDDDDRDQRQDRVVDKSPGVDRDFVEAEGKRDHGRHDRVQAQKRRESDEYPDRKSKRRPLGWIVDRKQTAKCGTETKHSLLKAS